jgi:hypothetical protein
MPYELTLGTADARLIYLALAYHLARPGSEVDPQTLKQTEHGLLEAARALHPQLNQAVATLSLTPLQLTRLGQAMLGVINELKTYPMLRAQSGDRSPVSAAAGFDDVLVTLFPDVAEDENAALDLAEDMMLLRRRLDALIRDAARAPDEEASAPSPSQPTKKTWQFWRR